MTGVERSQGSVVVATKPCEVERVYRLLRENGMRSAERSDVGGDRIVLEVPTASAAAARDLVGGLRSCDVIAVEGPLTEAHRTNWKSRTAPVRFSADAVVCFPWSAFDRRSINTVIEIDPAGGFGAGRHPSTLLLMRRLVGRRATGRLLDVGCGSGVLGVTAAVLGASHVEAIDISDAAVTATAANAALNNVGHLVSASATPLADVPGTFDIVVANIHAPILIELAPQLRRVLSPVGWLGLSGLSRAQTSVVGAAFSPLQVVETVTLDDWAAMVLVP